MRLAALLVVSAVACAFAACGDEESAAQRCVDSWNAGANEQRSSLAGAVAAVGLPSDAFRVGTWPKAGRKVPVHSTRAAFASPDGSAAISKGSCLIIVPPSREGEMAFFEAQGKWQFVRERTRFPRDARRSVADAEEASADATGKLKLK